VSTPHQGWSELHRHPKRVLRLSRVSSFSPGDQSSELKARFLVNGSHFRLVVGGLDPMLGEKDPERVSLAAGGGRTTPRHPCGHNPSQSTCKAGHTTLAPPRRSVALWPYAICRADSWHASMTSPVTIVEMPSLMPRSAILNTERGQRVNRGWCHPRPCYT
jgi:hypothetical protein